MQEIQKGAQTATVNTEHTLESPAITAIGSYVLMIDTGNMASGDTLELRVKTRAKSDASTTKLAVYAVFQHAQNEPIKYSIPCPCPGGAISFSLKQTTGTGRAYDWSILQL